MRIHPGTGSVEKGTLDTEPTGYLLQLGNGPILGSDGTGSDYDGCIRRNKGRTRFKKNDTNFFATSSRKVQRVHCRPCDGFTCWQWSPLRPRAPQHSAKCDASLLSYRGAVGPLSDNVIAGLDPGLHTASSHYAISLAKVHEAVVGLASWVEKIVDEAVEDERQATASGHRPSIRPEL